MINFKDYNELAQRAADAGKPLVLEFSAEWCGKCKMFAPIYDKVALAMSDKADFASVDADALPEAAEKYSVMNLPALVVIKGGEVVHNASGLLNEKSLTTLLEGLLG